ncbi:MAG: hypothetical protein H6652_27585 [Ardenticatenaceae bacterium]|nr:hypothetical protein [Ardenticatenaceae bacterium]MCB8948065.1 hypothetical protein [Ardenticatenaceae bacterium]
MKRILNQKLGFRIFRLLIYGVLETMPDEFDSHEFIAALAYQNQQIYIRELKDAGWDEPFQIINDAIIHWLEESGMVQPIGTRESENMFKQVSSVAMWKKV